MDDSTKAKVEERVVLQKFEGEPLPENEFERVEVVDGIVVQHSVIENGNVVGPVENSEIIGKDIGTLLTDKEEN